MEEKSVLWLNDARAGYEEISAICYKYGRAFRKQSVLCPCGDGPDSAFLKYFLAAFRYLELTGLACVDYNSNGQGHLRAWAAGRAGPDQAADMDIPSHGDILEPFSQDLMEKCDVIATMPPDSLFDDVLLFAVEMGKKFLLLGHIRHGGDGTGRDLLARGGMWMRPGLGGKITVSLSVGGPLPDSGWWRDDGLAVQAASGDLAWFGNLEV